MMCASRAVRIYNETDVDSQIDQFRASLLVIDYTSASLSLLSE
jgi:hypothetical protein